MGIKITTTTRTRPDLLAHDSGLVKILDPMYIWYAYGYRKLKTEPNCNLLPAVVET